MKKIISVLIPGALILGAFAPAPSYAEEAPATYAVSYADLDLADPADRVTLDRRLRAAAREMCGTGYGFDLRSQVRARECQELTLASIRIPQTRALAFAE